MSLGWGGLTGPTVERPGRSGRRVTLATREAGRRHRSGPRFRPFFHCSRWTFILIFSCDPRHHHQRIVSRIWPRHERLSRGSQPLVQGPPRQADMDTRSTESPASMPAGLPARKRQKPFSGEPNLGREGAQQRRGAQLQGSRDVPMIRVYVCVYPICK